MYLLVEEGVMDRGWSQARDPRLSETQREAGEGRVEERGGSHLNSSAGPAGIMSNSKEGKKACETCL